MSATPWSATSLVPYGQGRVRGLGPAELGIHGYQMDRLVALGLPTVPGITIPVCSARDLAKPAIARQVVNLMEELVGQRVGEGDHPILLRLLASAPVAASCLPPQVPGIGLTPANAASLAELIGREGDLYEVWASLLRLVAEEALHVSPDAIEDALDGVTTAGERVEALLAVCASDGTGPMPEDPAELLALSSIAVLKRWSSPRGRRARRSQELSDDLGLALHVQALHIGPWERSGIGTASSRDPDSGALIPSGAFHRGVRRSALPTAGSGEPLSSLPCGTDLLRHTLATLEHHLRDVAEVTFEIRDGNLSLLSAAALDRPSPRASLRLAVDLATAGTINRKAALQSVRPQVVQELLHAQLRLTGDEDLLVKGLAASPGAARGLVVLSSQRALELAANGVSTVLFSSDSNPGDVPALLAAAAVVTTSGGLASHAAVVARSSGTPAVCGAGDLRIDTLSGTVIGGGHTIHEGDVVTVDGRSGAVYLGEVEIRPAEPPAELETLLAWADDERVLRVRANADTVRDTEAALGLGAEGIGLCRTEHQFLGDRLPVVRRYLLAQDDGDRREALDALTEAQCDDFQSLLRAVGDRPATIRLLDAPLHEFLPHDGKYKDEAQLARAVEMREVNPMLGLRGVRLALLNNDLYPAQAEALFSAWVTVSKEGINPQLEVMIPLVSLPEELAIAIDQVQKAADKVEEQTGIRVPYLVGSMIETPRAALLADQLAVHADFLSFGTNDLTQMTYGFSRDDVEGRLLANYIDRGLLSASPFVEFDLDGVGALVTIAVQKARSVKPDIKLGLCGEHGGDAISIMRLAPFGLDYVSCSPQRVPIARLAAAHAIFEEPS